MNINVKILIIIEIIGLLLLVLVLASATTIDTSMTVNGSSSSLDLVFRNEDIVSVSHVEINGIGYVRILYDDGSERIMELEEYIRMNEGNWNDKGTCNPDFYRISRWIQNIMDWILGRNKNPTVDEVFAGTQLARAFVTRNEYNQLLYQNYLLNLRLESIENTLDKEALCQSRLKTSLKYNITNFNCDNTTYIQVNDNYIGITPF